MPRLLLAFCDLIVSEYLDERGRQSAFGKQIAKDIRDTKRDLIRVVDKTDAEITRKHHFADEPEEAREHYGNRDDAGRACDAGLSGTRKCRHNGLGKVFRLLRGVL